MRGALPAEDGMLQSAPMHATAVLRDDWTCHMEYNVDGSANNYELTQMTKYIEYIHVCITLLRNPLRRHNVLT